MSFPKEPEVSSGDAGLRFPLSDLQQAYLVGRAWRRPRGAGSHFYSEFERSDLDVPRLQAAWRRLIDRHDMLRARVTEDGEGLVLPEVPPFDIAVADLASADAAGRENELAAIRGKMSHRLYDPHRWPLFDLRVSRLPANRFRLHFSFDLLMLDAASIRRLLAGLRELYEDPERAGIPTQPGFREYAIARQSLREGRRFAQARAYWKERLPELAVRPALPVATDPNGIESPRFTRRSGALAAPQWGRLRQSAGKLGLTPAALLAAAFGEVLGRWCNQRRFTLNVARLERLHAHPRIESPAGNFTTTTLLAINLDGPDFPSRARDLMARLRRDARHGLYSGIRVLRAMRQRQLMPDDYGMPVVFTSLLAPRAGAGQRALSTGWLGDCVYEISQTPQVWLDHQAAEQEGSLIFHWDAIEGLFPPGLIEDMFPAYTEYLDLLASGAVPGPAISRLALSAVQRERRDLYNATDAPRAPGLLHAGFFAMSEKQPSQIAVDDPRRRVSYGELAGRACSAARRLREAGIGEGDLVAVVMEKGWEQIASVLGILRAGAAYLPIDPKIPRARLEYLLSNGRVSIAWTQPRLREALAWPSAIKVWTLEEEDGAPGPYDGPEPGPDSLAYVIYTSGSSGAPKGVMISHRAALNTIADINRRLEISAADRVLAVSSLTFDLSVYDIFGILERGGAVVLPAPERSRDPTHWIDRMNEAGVTIWNSAPALMQMLVTLLDAPLEHPPASLRWALLSGDWIPVELPDRIRQFAPNCRLLGLGGATEASIWSIAYPIGRVDPAWTSIPYGMPLANQRIHVLDDSFEPCPEWTAGELYIGGDGLALGYWADEAKTAERFVRSPLTGELLYRTGDYGRFRPEGYIEFLGRRDTQIKIRGHRVEIGEIEASLLRHHRVREAAALVVPGTSQDQSPGVLVGCVVLDKTAPPPESQPAPDENELRAHLTELLPTHMIPSRIVVLDKLPLNPNGKVDRNALSKPEVLAGRERQSNTLAPKSGMEERIHRVWTRILQRSEAGLDENFFETGGDSLLAIQFQNDLRRELDLRVDLADLFRHPTIRSLAALVAGVGEARANLEETRQRVARRRAAFARYKTRLKNVTQG